MKSKKIMIIPAVLLAGCSSAPEWKKNITPESEYNINSVAVELESRCPAPSFMTEKQLADEFEKNIKKTFCKEKKCSDKIASDTIAIDIKVNYHRTFMAEAVSCSESYASSELSYSFDLKKGGDLFYSRPKSGNFVPARGLIGNLGRIASQLSFSAGPENEKNDLEYMTGGVAKQILKDIG